MKRFCALLTALWLLCAPARLSAEELSAPEPETVLTAEELQRAEEAIDALNPALSLEEKLDKVMERYDALGACVVIFQNGSITYTYCYGVASPGGAAITPDTGFQVGSISKMIANMGLMKLLDERGISLETELGEVLGYPVRHPAYPNTPITLRQLMSHTASLRDSGYYQQALHGEICPLAELFSGNRLEYAFHPWEPGTRREYSNLGGGLIGSLIERLSGELLDDYLNEHIFLPLDITAGYQAALLPDDMPLADMYWMPQKQLAKVLRGDTDVTYAASAETHYVYTAGKLIISAPDLAKLMIALCDGGVYGDTRVLRESTAAKILTRQNHFGSVACESGHGLFMNIITDNQVQGRTMYGHGGKANGMLCAAYFDPADRTGVVMLTNGCDNRPVHNGVGMLGRMVMRVCYQDYIDLTHEAADPFLVE